MTSVIFSVPQFFCNPKVSLYLGRGLYMDVNCSLVYFYIQTAIQYFSISMLCARPLIF